MPFDHIVVVMMENHSFDNLLGALARSGQPAVDGLTFDGAGAADQHQPRAPPARPATVARSHSRTPPRARTSRRAGTRPTSRSTAARWTASCARSTSTQPMGYYTPEVLPFAYSLAAHVHARQPLVLLGAVPDLSPTAASCWPAPRTATIATDASSLLDTAAQRHDLRPPPRHGISWRNYFTDVPDDGDDPVDRREAPGQPAHRSTSSSTTAPPGTLPGGQLRRSRRSACSR